LSVTYADIIYQMGLKNKIEVEMSKNSNNSERIYATIPTVPNLAISGQLGWRRAARAETAL
jgi:hypothetical protein